MKKRLAALALLCVCIVTYAATDAEQKVARAASVLDAYYGDRATLLKAVALLDEAAKVRPWSAALFVQAARATITGGHLVDDKFRGNTIEREMALLDEATKLEPGNHKAYILRSEAYRILGRHDDALAQLQTAHKIRPDDPWLWHGYADLYARMSNYAKAKEAWSKAIELSREPSEEHRRAEVAAYSALARRAAGEGEVAELERMASAIDRRRHPDDAWTLSSLSSDFFYVEKVDEAIAYARRSLDVMEHGVGRRWLATGLYAKACIERQSGRPWESYYVEARNLGFDRTAVIQYLPSFDPGRAQRLAATLLALPEPRQ